MARPIMEKLSLWRRGNTGVMSRFHSQLKESPFKREDIATLQVKNKMDRSDLGQRMRLKHYPSIDIPKEPLYAGYLEGSLDDAKEYVRELGFRSNPTAYVEVTEEDGADDGSYSRQYVTETASKVDIPQAGGFVSPLRRVKEQVHITFFDQENTVDILAHRERSAWLQPTRHVVDSQSNARRGVRDFRQLVYDETGSELPGKARVKWDVSV